MPRARNGKPEQTVKAKTKPRTAQVKTKPQVKTKRGGSKPGREIHRLSVVEQVRAGQKIIAMRLAAKPASRPSISTTC